MGNSLGTSIMKRALVFGCGGQDGSYLCETLLKNGYEVFGTTRKSSVDNLQRIQHIRDKFTGFYRVDLTDQLSVFKAISGCGPHEIYNEADQDNIGWSHSIPGYSIDVTIKGALNILEATRYLNPECKVFLPVSATIFGDTSAPQDENSHLNPLSPYACAKASVLHLARYYRQVHGMWVSTGILYNHDSPRRGKGYLLQDIYSQCLDVQAGVKDTIVVGSTEQIVDIGYAREFAEGIYAILQCGFPTDMILSSGRSFKIYDIIDHYCKYLEIGTLIKVDPDRNHNALNTQLIGDINKAQYMIGWKPKYNALNMIEVLHDGDKGT